MRVAGSTRSGSLAAGSGPHYFRTNINEDLIVDIKANFPFSNDLGYSLQLCDSNDGLIASTAEVTLSGNAATATLQTRLRTGTYYIVVGSSGATSYTVQVLLADSSELFEICQIITTNFPNDPLYGCQWYLKRPAVDVQVSGELIFQTSGEDIDINIEEVWDDSVFGAEINVAVVDHGMDTDHEDLADNVDTTLSHDYSGSGDLYSPFSGRGTRVAGIIAAVGDNSLGVRGVAPQANIYSYNLAGNFSDANAKDAMIRNMDTTAVSVNNWGPKDLPVLTEASSEWEEGVRTGIREGFGGKGVFYVWAAGDGHEGSDQANFDEYSNYYAVTTVCSAEISNITGNNNIIKSSFSEEGFNLWVCAPGSDIVTTNNNDGYTFEFPGTSNSAAVVSGIAALIREVNSDLSWRDLKLILAGSASHDIQLGFTDTAWRPVAFKYGSDSERYRHNPKFGFGMADAAAAAELAGSWTNVPPPMRPLTVSSGNIDTVIPDFTTGEDVSDVFTLTVPDIDIPGTEVFTEFIEIGINFTHPFFPFLDIEITSPDGTVSKLVEAYPADAISHLSDRSVTVNDFKYTGREHRFGLANHLGTDPAGEWTLKITNNSPSGTGTLHSWNIKVYGHMSGDTPTFNSWTIPDKNYVPGIAVKETLPEATAGNGELTYSLSPLSLPVGLTFSETDRVISGTPTAVSSGSYTYTVTDEDGDTDELIFTIRVTTTPPGPTDPPTTGPPTRRPTSSGTGGGGGGCAVSDQNEAASDLLTALASLMLIPVSVVIRRKIRSRIKT